MIIHRFQGKVATRERERCKFEREWKTEKREYVEITITA
jgi:hypothetical protein